MDENNIKRISPGGKIYESLVKLRHEIHSNPELSGEENETPQRILNYLQRFSPSFVEHGIGGNGMAVGFEGKEQGPVVVIRAELDALPIPEENSFSYWSVKNGISHKCGHDGHMVMVTGLAPLLNEFPVKRGKVILLYQPAEETGEGAEWVVNDLKFKSLKPDYIFALHNLPGFPRGKVILKDEIFASASEGMVIQMKGATSHAAHPENGRNPGFPMARIILDFRKISEDKRSFKDFALITPIHARLGEIAFGTSPGEGELMATIRAFYNEDLKLTRDKALRSIEQHCKKEGIEYYTSFREHFPSTVNDKESLDIMEKAVEMTGLAKGTIYQPFKWSEDFGQFSGRYKTGFFGLGSGKDQPQLHNANFDFPDEIIPNGIRMFERIIREITGNND